MATNKKQELKSFILKTQSLALYIQIYTISQMYDQIHLTGFKKFGNVQVNPTELIIDQLTKQPIPNVFPSKLDVTVNQVDQYIQHKKKQQCQAKNRILNVHFGVGPNQVYFLQNCAYNNKDFRIPDNNGKVCQNQKICHKLSLDEALKTRLNLEMIASKLNKQHGVEISTDPGRYLCNYVYFSSLNQLKCDKDNVDCLFVHFPGLNVTSHEKNIKFVKNLLQILLVK